MGPRRRPAKRPRTNDGWMMTASSQSLTRVPLPDRLGNSRTGSSVFVETKLASIVHKEIFLDRLQKEIVERFDLKKKQPKGKQDRRHCPNCEPDETTQGQQDIVAANTTKRQQIFKTFIWVGLSVCSKALVKSNFIDLLVVASDFDPVYMAAHLPVLAHQKRIPILLLPDASAELGAVLGIRCAGVVAFSLQAAAAATTTRMRDEEQCPQESKLIHEKLASFLSFVKENLM